MWPPQSVKTWPTPACFRTRATSWPPVRSATRQPGHHVRREALDLLALLRGGADRVEDDVVAAGGAKALDRLHALLGGADDPVLPREGLEVLRVALRERLGPHGLGRLVIAAHGDEGQVCRGEALQLAPGDGRRRADLVEALRVALGLDHVRDPAVPLPAGACERGVGATTDPDGRPGLLHGLRVDRHALEIREAPLERRRRVAPQRADEVELLVRRLERELDAEAQTADAHRGKASLTPPSTVSVQPVVLDARSEARNSTASATSSGRMRAPSKLRLR